MNDMIAAAAASGASQLTEQWQQQRVGGERARI